MNSERLLQCGSEWGCFGENATMSISPDAGRDSFELFKSKKFVRFTHHQKEEMETDTDESAREDSVIDERKQRRRERNRLAAQRCRLKKRVQAINVSLVSVLSMFLKKIIESPMRNFTSHQIWPISKCGSSASQILCVWCVAIFLIDQKFNKAHMHHL